MYRRSQVIEVNVRRSAFEGSNKVIGWTDEGFYVELSNSENAIGQRARVVLRDIRRSFSVADLIMPGAPAR